VKKITYRVFVKLLDWVYKFYKLFPVYFVLSWNKFFPRLEILDRNNYIYQKGYLLRDLDWGSKDSFYKLLEIVKDCNNFSITIDYSTFIQLLIDQSNYQTARKYWNKLAERLRKVFYLLVLK